MIIYGKQFVVSTFNLLTDSWEKLTAEVVNQLSGPFQTPRSRILIVRRYCESPRVRARWLYGRRILFAMR